MPSVDFKSAVIERSRTVPVVVDFWAAWCAPCRILGPVLEDLVAEAGGRWELVKLNTEEQPEIARAYGIMSIPDVRLFLDGRVAAQFVGALPASEIRRWLDQHIPDPRLDRLRRIVAPWAKEGGASVLADLEAFAREHPDLAEGRLRLAQVVVVTEPGRARELIRTSGAGSDHADLQADVGSLADLMECSLETAKPRFAENLEAARRSLRDHDLRGAAEHLIEAVMRDRQYGDEVARRAAVALFRLLGPDHELTQECQRRFSMALHS